MVEINGAIAKRQLGRTVSFTFERELDAMHFYQSAQCVKLKPKSGAPDNAVQLFHIQRGCCDGSDPSGCHRRFEAERERLEKERREAKRVARETAADEYEGTEPSLGDVAFCGHRSNHSLLRMGERCGYCGFVA